MMYEPIGKIEAGSQPVEQPSNGKCRASLRARSGRATPATVDRKWSLGHRGITVLNYVREQIALTGMAPSYGEIMEALNFGSRSDVAQCVRILEKRGLLSRVGGGKCPRTVNSAKVRRIMLSARTFAQLDET